MPKKKKNILKQKVGKPPGTLVYTGDKTVEEALFTLTVYDAEGYETKTFSDDRQALKSFVPGKVNWLNVQGISHVDRVERLGRALGFHSLILEDILHVDQLPKIDIYEKHVFLTMKMLTYNEEEAVVESEHISMVLGEEYLISFQESRNDIFRAIYERIASPTTKVKARKADYLLYYLTDLLVDYYYLLVEELDEEVEKLENELHETPSDDTPKKIIHLKRKHTQLRRILRPLAESLRSLKKYDALLIEDYVIEYMNDVLDHLVQFEDSLMSRQETLSGLMDLYMSAISNRMNRVMYTLTIVAAIFIPLTFLAGIYGMNFQHMPELEYRYSYFILLGIMLVIGLGMFVYMKRKRWF